MKGRMTLVCLGTLGCILWMLSACSDFLDVTPRGKRVVQNVEDHRDILANYLYFMKKPQRDQMELFGVSGYYYAYPWMNNAQFFASYTGEAPLPRNRQNYDPAKQQWTPYALRMLNWTNIGEASQAWIQYYQMAGPLNMLIQDIDDAEGDDDMRRYVKGEALVWRAYAYFKLLQYYAPYKDNAVGIPLFLNPADNIGTAMPPRSTLAEVFKQIIDDCRLVLEYLKLTPAQTWNLAYREDFTHAMLAAVYLWKAGSGAAEPDDWKHAKEEAEAAIGGRHLLSSTEELKNLFDCSAARLTTTDSNPEFFIRLVDDGDGYTVLSAAAYYPIAGEGFESMVPADPEILKLYADNDRRKAFYFVENPVPMSDVFGTQPEPIPLGAPVPGIFNDKYNRQLILDAYSLLLGSEPSVSGVFMPFRLAEMFLIKAEAACRMGDVNTGLETLRAFRASRYDNPEDFTGDAERVLQEILNERKREFFMEYDSWWLDMKRLGKTMKRELNGETYELKGDDFKYTFPVPTGELKDNKNIRQLEEWYEYFQ